MGSGDDDPDEEHQLSPNVPDSSTTVSKNNNNNLTSSIHSAPSVGNYFKEQEESYENALEERRQRLQQLALFQQQHESDNTNGNDESSPPSRTRRNYVFSKRKSTRVYVLKHVPESYKNRPPPYPAYRKTVDGREFLAFFTKIFGFSNLFPTSFNINGIHYCCSEQYYMFKKARYFGFNAIAKEIMLTRDAKLIKHLGTADTMRQRQANGAESESRPFDHDEWLGVKKDVMRIALREKFLQNHFLFDMLIQSGDAYIVEASATDHFWGIGCGLGSEEIADTRKWVGQNWMGNLLMRLREEFRKNFRRSSDFSD